MAWKCPPLASKCYSAKESRGQGISVVRLDGGGDGVRDRAGWGRMGGGGGAGDWDWTGMEQRVCCDLASRMCSGCGRSETCFFPHPFGGIMDQLFSKDLGPKCISWKC